MQRDKLIDITKGLGILLVIFAHTYKGEASGMVYYFHMPLFFILTGCALTYSKSTSIKWERLFMGIFVPYLVFSLITFTYWAFIESKFRPIHDNGVFPCLNGFVSYKVQQFINIFTAIDTEDAFIYNIVLWYLPCLFACRVLYGLTNKTKYPIVWVAVIGCVGVFLTEVIKYSLPLCIELALVSLPFIFFGNRFYGKYKSHSNKQVLTTIFGGGICVLVLIKWKTNISVDLHIHNLANGWIYLTALIGSVATLSLCKLLVGTKIEQPLLFLGKNSLLIMCLHEPIKRIVIKVMAVVAGMETDILRQDLFVSIAVILIVIALLLPCIYAVNKWMPWCVGKQRV